MARIQLVLSDGDRERYIYHAKREEKSLSAWLREAAQEKIDKDTKDDQRPFTSAEEVRAFFRECDAMNEGFGPELDWEEVKKIIEESGLDRLGIT